MARKGLMKYIQNIRNGKNKIERGKNIIRVVENGTVVERTTNTLRKKVKMDLQPLDMIKKIRRSMVKRHTNGRDKLLKFM